MWSETQVQKMIGSRDKVGGSTGIY
jgi:hypothetical protein